MKKFIRWIPVVAMLAAAGCGGNQPAPTKRNYSEEEKAATKAADKSVDDDEKSGSGTATGKPKKK